MNRALSVKDVEGMRKRTLPLTGAWADMLGHPERTGVWFVWGQSANGKTSFLLDLSKELCKFGRVAYNSREEGASLTMQNAMRRHGMMSVNRRFQLLDEPMKDMGERMSRRKSPDFYIVDSFQYCQMSYKQYIEFKEAHKDKLVIFVSHAEGSAPEGRAAKAVRYDASQKIWVEGFVAHSKGRYIGPLGKYVIWRDQAIEYWGETYLTQRINLKNK
jgi:hypothetical protein